MAWATIAEVEAQFPELTGMVTDLEIEVAKCVINPGLWGSKQHTGHMLAVAHLTVAAGEDAPIAGLKTVTERKLDKIQTKYATATPPASGAIDWSTTKHGQRFLLMKCSIPSIGAVSPR